MGKYMIVLRGHPSEWKKISENQQSEIIQKYMAWVEKLKAENLFRSGSELHPVYRDVRSVNNKVVVDGPFPETKEVLTGYFIVTADTLDAAVEVSKGCPALTHGDWLQVYEMPNRD